MKNDLILSQKWSDLMDYCYTAVIPHIPKTMCFTLGLRLENSMWDIDALIGRVELNKNDKLQCLRQIDEQKYLFLRTIRRAVQLKIINQKRYELIAKKVDEVGRIIGGLLKRNK